MTNRKDDHEGFTFHKEGDPKYDDLSKSSLTVVNLFKYIVVGFVVIEAVRYFYF